MRRVWHGGAASRRSRLHACSSRPLAGAPAAPSTPFPLAGQCQTARRRRSDSLRPRRRTTRNARQARAGGSRATRGRCRGGVEGGRRPSAVTEVTARRPKTCRNLARSNNCQDDKAANRISYINIVFSLRLHVSNLCTPCFTDRQTVDQMADALDEPLAGVVPTGDAVDDLYADAGDLTAISTDSLLPIVGDYDLGPDTPKTPKEPKEPASASLPPRLAACEEVALRLETSTARTPCHARLPRPCHSCAPDLS